jgi:hypothetical protein
MWDDPFYGMDSRPLSGPVLLGVILVLFAVVMVWVLWP